MNVGNFSVMMILFSPFALAIATIFVFSGLACMRMFKRCVQAWYAQRAMKKGAVCYRNGETLVVHYTK